MTESSSTPPSDNKEHPNNNTATTAASLVASSAAAAANGNATSTTTNTDSSKNSLKRPRSEMEAPENEEVDRAGPEIKRQRIHETNTSSTAATATSNDAALVANPTNDINYFDSKFKGALLHTHFSGTVKSSTIFDFIFRPENQDKLFFFTEKRDWNLGWASGDCPHSHKKNGLTRERLENLMKEAWNSKNFHRNFKMLGNLFFFLLKNEDFYPHYLDLIMQEMREQHLEHIELRLKLGSLFKWRKGRMEFLSIQQEMDLLMEAQKKFRKNGLSMVVIAQSSKHFAPRKVQKQFNGILNQVTRNRKYLSLIKGFDLVGHEMEASPISVFGGVLNKLKQRMEREKLDIPFLFHAGEDFKDLKKAHNNLDFALRYGKHRIGHGIYAITRDDLKQRIRQENMVLEFCPCSMDYFEHLQSDTLQVFRDSKLKFCINSDDSNKLHDSDLNSNIRFLLEHGYTQKQIIESIRVSIEASLCDEDIKKQMLNRWRKEYNIDANL